MKCIDQDRIHYSYIKYEYKNPEVIITENGWPDGGQLNDRDRVVYIGEHLKEILKVITQDECNVTGYTGNENKNKIQLGNFPNGFSMISSGFQLGL